MTKIISSFISTIKNMKNLIISQYHSFNFLLKKSAFFHQNIHKINLIKVELNKNLININKLRQFNGFFF